MFFMTVDKIEIKNKIKWNKTAPQFELITLKNTQLDIYLNFH